MTETIKLIVGKYKYPVLLLRADGRLFFKFDFNRKLMAEIKAMAGAKYHDYDTAETKAWLRAELGTSKVWSVWDNQRNWFQLDALQGNNPYAAYDGPIKPFEPWRLGTLREHQLEMTAFGLTRHYCIWAAEMGTGKTLSAIELMEASGYEDWWYVAPRGALKAVERELRVWKSRIAPKLMTYEGLVKEMKNWVPGQKAPHGVIFDESSRTKNPHAIRSQAAQNLANGIRHDHGRDGFVILMSGSPAPKAPTDWWSQCEIAQPGFLREGDVDKFKLRLGVFEESTSSQGSKFQKKVAWLDDVNRCKICGLYADDAKHIQDAGMKAVMGEGHHLFIESVNEVATLYQRMNGLVIVKFKKDCLDLPDKIYRQLTLTPDRSTLRAASSITNRTRSAAQALILLRELSDGFQYEEEPTGNMGTCGLCSGLGRCQDFKIKPSYEAALEAGENLPADAYDSTETSCWQCNGTGQQEQMRRVEREVPSPKEDALRDILDEHYDIGRLVVYGGFTGSVNRCCRVAGAEGWAVIRVDGRGWSILGADGVPIVDDALELFQKKQEQYPRVCFIGQPGAAGMGLTLTASPTICYYSNDFNAESRIQSEDRIHRMGMDVNKGATIIDLLHLPTDLLVLNNLQKKRELQSMTMGEVAKALRDAGASDERLF